MKHLICKPSAIAVVLTLIGGMAWAQNPILRSTTTGTPTSFGQVGQSLLTQKSYFVGLGTTNPTQRFTLTSYVEESPSFSGEGNEEESTGGSELMSSLHTPASIRYEFYDGAAWKYWHLRGGSSFDIVNPTTSTTLMSLNPVFGVNFLGNVHTSVPGAGGNNYVRVGAETSARVISWASYTNPSNNLNIPLQFTYKYLGTGAYDLPVLTLMPTGRVGIGTAAPSEKLEVSGGHVKVTNGNILIANGTFTVNNGSNQFKVFANGSVRARRIDVDLDAIPDYVFKPDYDLMPIKELRRYVTEKQHLPGIPSEREYKERGSMDLGELNMKLLEKVEELTLYILQLEERIQMLEKK